jgi:plasmid stabilization system protein ParE
MIEKYIVKWAAPARDDLDEIIDYIFRTNMAYAVKVLDKIELAVIDGRKNVEDIVLKKIMTRENEL